MEWKNGFPSEHLFSFQIVKILSSNTPVSFILAINPFIGSSDVIVVGFFKSRPPKVKIFIHIIQHFPFPNYLFLFSFNIWFNNNISIIIPFIIPHAQENTSYANILSSPHIVIYTSKEKKSEWQNMFEFFFFYPMSDFG